MDINYERQQFKDPQSYNDNLDQLKQVVPMLLNEYKIIFVTSKMNPTNQEYQQQLSNIENALNQIKGKLFTISNDVQVNIDEINAALVYLDKQIKEKRKENKLLKKQLGIVENESNASLEMIDDYTQIYNQRYLRNWALGLTTLLCITTIGIVFKKEGV
jgi:hypothetical protein